MKKILRNLFIIAGILLCTISIQAEEYKTGGGRYVQFGNFWQASAGVPDEQEIDTIKIKDYINGVPVTQIKNEGFRGNHVRRVLIPDTVTSIGYGAFQESAIEELTIPEKVSWVERWLAMDCKNLKKVNWKTALEETIPPAAFLGCSKLSDVKIASGVENIEDSAFAYCTSLKEITLPKTIKTIEARAFADCSNLKKVHIPSRVNYIAGNAFDGAKKLVLYGQKNSYAEYYAKAHGISFKAFGTDLKPIENRPLIKTLKVSGNTLKASLYQDVPGAVYYNFYILSDIWEYSDRIEFERVYYRKVSTSKPYVKMYNLPKGNLKIFCSANVNGKIVWSYDMCFSIKNPPVNEPEIKKVTVRDNRVAVAVNAPKNSKGYDCVLASSWIEDKPYKCDYVIKDQTGSVARFKNVKPGTYYLSTHAFVREKLNTGKKVFSTWTPPRKIVIK